MEGLKDIALILCITALITQTLLAVLIYYRLFKITKNMATFTDIQGSLSTLGNAIVAVQNKVTALEQASTGTISAADAETIKTAIDGAATSLNTIAGIAP